MRTILFLSLSIALLFLAGCSGNDSRPSDMPRLYPVSITITQEGQPLEGATVALEAETPSIYSASGITNASGVAVLRTYGFNGAPAGNYVVLVSKTVAENQREITTFEGTTELVGGESYGHVDPLFSRADTSTLRITVTERGATETFDVGAPVRVFLWNNPTN